MNRRQLAWIPGLAFCACASVHHYDAPLTDEAVAELREMLPQTAEVSWTDGTSTVHEPANALIVTATNTSWSQGPDTSWTRGRDSARRTVPVEALRKIEWTSHSRGAEQGLLIGGAATAVLFAIAGAASGNDPPCPGPGHEVFFCFSGSAAQKAVLGAVVGFIPGALVGALVGAGVGSHVEARFGSQ
jgi:hypothetical protein